MNFQISSAKITSPTTDSNWGGCFVEGNLVVLLEIETDGKILASHLGKSVFDALLLAYLMAFKKGRREGWVAEGYFLGYAAGRFVLEFWRGDNHPVYGLTIPQWTSYLIILFVLLIKPFRSSSSI